MNYQKKMRLQTELREWGVPDTDVATFIDVLDKAFAQESGAVRRAIVSYMEPSLVLAALSEMVRDDLRADEE